MRRALLPFTVGIALALNARPAAACGGVVSPAQSVVVQSQQRVLISLRADGSTRVVVQLGIPGANAPFGALTPVAGLPTLDPKPVDSEELDTLDKTTRPVLRPSESDSGGGCGCGSAADTAGGTKGGGGGVSVVQMVDIGPVTAAVLAASSGAELTQWLGDNGFAVPAGDQAVVATYIGPGKFFVAFKRNDTPSGASSVGVSFSVPGDQRGYPLRISRVGADTRLGIQVFVAAPEVVSPTGSAPAGNFQTLTLKDFPFSELYADYTGTLYAGIQQRGGKAFVVESVYGATSGWRDQLGPRLQEITESGQVLSRLATVVAPTQLTEDVAFTGNAPNDVPKEIAMIWHPLGAPGGPGRYGELYMAASGLALAGLGLRRRRRS